jgi:hypothetical protein
MWKVVDRFLSSIVRTFRIYVKTLPKAIILVVLVAIAIVLSADVDIWGGHERFRNGGVGELIYRICLSVISSFVFYVIVTHTKEQINKSHINKIVYQRSQRVVDLSADAFYQLERASGAKKRSAYQTREEVKKICTGIKLPHEVKSWNPPDQRDIIKVLDHYRKGIQDSIRSVLELAPLLMAEHVALLSAIEDSNYLQTIEQVAPINLGNPDLGFLSDKLFEFMEQVRQLALYNIKKLRIYDPNQYWLDQLLSKHRKA